MQDDDCIMCRFYCIAFIEYMIARKEEIKHNDLISGQQEKVFMVLNYFEHFLFSFLHSVFVFQFLHLLHWLVFLLVMRVLK